MPRTIRGRRAACLATLTMLTTLTGALGGCSASPATGRMQLIMIGPEQEVAMGREAAPEMVRQSGGEAEDPALQHYVDAVGQRLARHAERELPWAFTVVRDASPNAFALPGGRIFVTAGLIARMSDERQLAAVLGHEIGHVTDRHGILGVQRQLGAGLLLELAAAASGEDYAGAVKAGGTLAANFLNLSYSREQEYLADELGMRYMSEAGYDVRGMVELLNLLHSQSQSDPPQWSELLRTHPLTRNRIDRAEGILQTRYGGGGTDSDSPAADMAEMAQRARRQMIEPDQDAADD